MNALGMAVGLVSLASVAHGAAVLQYQWNFNETGTTAASSVPGGGTANLSLVNSGNSPTDLHGAAGSGVSGLSGDRALDNTASTAGASGGLGRAVNFSNTTVGATAQFAVTAWVKPTSVGGFGRILVLGNGNDPSGTNSIALMTSPSSYANGFNGTDLGQGLEFNINGGNRRPNVPLPLNQWTFIAAEYTQNPDTTSTINVYSGTTSSSVTLVLTSVVPAAGLGTPDLNGANDLTTAFVGNRSGRDRAFDGFLDDVRFYTGTFGSVAAVDAVRASAVPEPATAGLLLVSGALFTRRVRK